MNRLRSLSIVLFAMVAFTACMKVDGNKQNNTVRRPVQLPSDYPNVDNQIYGTWASSQPVAQQGNVSVWFLIYFNQSGVASVSAQCVYPDGDLIATTRVSVRITGNSIDLLQAGQSTQLGPNNETCNVNVKPGSFMYQVVTDSLRMVELSTNTPMSFTRMR